MQYNFRLVTEADYDRLESIPDAKTWLDKNHDRSDFDLDLDFTLAEGINKNVVMIPFRWSRNWYDTRYMIIFNQKVCVFTFDREKRKFPKFEILYYGDSIENKEQKLRIQSLIQSIFIEGGRYLIGNIRDYEIALLQKIKFTERLT